MLLFLLLYGGQYFLRFQDTLHFFILPGQILTGIVRGRVVQEIGNGLRRNRC